MRYRVQITGNNSTRNSGDTLVIEFNSALASVSSVASVDVEFEPWPLPSNVWHDIELRWSHDKMSWSAWAPYITNNSRDSAILQKVVDTGRDFFIQLKAIRAGVDTTELNATAATIIYSEGEEPEEALESPFNESNCSASSCLSTNYCNGFNLSCDPSALFRPYDSMGPAIKMFHDLNCVAAEIYGICVRYFRVEPLEESADAVLKEYSIFDATDVKDIKVMVPNNEIPDNRFTYTELDMDFMVDGFEIQIVPQHFERAFGKGKFPQENDFIYIPIIDRLFEVNSSYLFRSFMAEPAYHKVMLYKANDKTNVLKDRARPEIGEAVEDMTVSFEDILRKDIDEEADRITKPLQYKTISIGGYDHVRSAINETLEIKEEDVYNYFTLISKYRYDMSSVEHDQLAVRYKAKVPSTDRVAFSFWIQPTKSTLDHPTDIILTNATGASGMSLSLDYGLTGPTGSQIIAPVSANLTIGASSFAFDNLTTVAGQWYGFVLNVMPSFGQVELSIWEMKPASEKTTALRLAYHRVRDCDPTTTITSEDSISLPGSDCLLTSIRLWKESIEEEKQPTILNQYVVKDSHLSSMIDDCIPPLRMHKQYNR